MDDSDDADLSPIIMLIKFPRLRTLSAKHRKENTNIEVDLKLLQEMLKFGSIKPGSLPIEKLNIYHYYMDFEPYLSAYQKTWNKISMHPHVELDIRICGYLPEDQKENELERELSLLEQRIQRLQMNLDGNRRFADQLTHGSNTTVNRCQRILCTTAKCWSCGYRFNHCWKCVPVCEGCGIKRIPPMANDNQIRLKTRRQNQLKSQIKADEDDFSVFG
jgi:predicted Zn-ribbon and HTH transcriptional regulator